MENDPPNYLSTLGISAKLLSDLLAHDTMMVSITLRVNTYLSKVTGNFFKCYLYYQRINWTTINTSQRLGSDKNSLKKNSDELSQMHATPPFKITNGIHHGKKSNQYLKNSNPKFWWQKYIIVNSSIFYYVWHYFTYIYIRYKFSQLYFTYIMQELNKILSQYMAQSKNRKVTYFYFIALKSKIASKHERKTTHICKM